MVRLGYSWLWIAIITLTLQPARADERILNFVSDVQIARNGDLTVTETIKVQARSQQIRRGILREIPTTYMASNGSRIAVDFKLLSVTRNGAPETHATEKIDNGVRIRIGSIDRLLAVGAHEFSIRYQTTRQVGFFPDFDELFWNATGTGWSFAIDVAEARIALPEQTKILQSSFYTGPQGSRDRDAIVIEQKPGYIAFRTTKALPPRNGLTVAASWAKGVILTPQQAQAAARKAIRDRFISQYAVQAWSHQDALLANPFPYQSKVVGIRANFDQMISQSEARFGSIIVTGVPSKMFTADSRTAVLAFRVDGLRQSNFMGSPISLPYGRFVGVYICTQRDCDDFFDR